MIVCHCHAVSHREVEAAAHAGARHVGDVAEACRAGSDCHGCHRRIDAILEAARVRLVLQDAC